jgi:hypothetical protein
VVVTGASPGITVTDTTAGGAVTTVPVSVMRGVTAGNEDYHYGNNVVLNPGHAYKAIVTLNGETATMTVTVP